MTMVRTPPPLPVRDRSATRALSPMLTRLAEERATGVLVREHGTLYLAEGRVVHAESPLAPGLDVLLTAHGTLATAAWQRAAAASEGPLHAAELLLESGLLPAGALELCHLDALYDAGYFALAPSSTPGRFHYDGAPRTGPLPSVPVVALERETLRRRLQLHRLWPEPAADTAPLIRADPAAATAPVAHRGPAAGTARPGHPDRARGTVPPVHPAPPAGTARPVPATGRTQPIGPAPSAGRAPGPGGRSAGPARARPTPVTPRQRAVLDRVNGTRTAADIARELGRQAFHTLVDVRRLAAAGHLRPVAPEPPAPATAPTTAPTTAPEQARSLPPPLPLPPVTDPDIALLKRLRDALEAL
ncbi:transcriptional regulator [Streptomyces sp. NPDC014983]|uniref:transcriptional regulator n=1 Tax=Streptomyces sp. NPDC014983 TaxID=3364933 RepID=UPI0036F8B96C